MSDLRKAVRRREASAYTGSSSASSARPMQRPRASKGVTGERLLQLMEVAPGYRLVRWGRCEPHRGAPDRAPITAILVTANERQHAVIQGGPGATVEVAATAKEQLRIKGAVAAAETRGSRRIEAMQGNERHVQARPARSYLPSTINESWWSSVFEITCNRINGAAISYRGLLTCKPVDSETAIIDVQGHCPQITPRS